MRQRGGLCRSMGIAGLAQLYVLLKRPRFHLHGVSEHSIITRIVLAPCAALENGNLGLILATALSGGNSAG